MNRKGLTKYTLEVVVAIIGLVILGYFVSVVYNNFVQNQEMKNAQKTINLIEAKINAIKEGEKTSYTIQGFKAIEGTWYLMGWDKQDKDRPGKCAISSCICICKVESPRIPLKKETDTCQENGFCRKMGDTNIKVTTFHASQFGSYPNPSEAYTKVTEWEYIGIPNELLSNIEIEKNNTLFISFYSDAYLAYKRSTTA